MNQADLIVAGCMQWRPQNKSVEHVWTVTRHAGANATSDYLNQGDWFLVKELPANLFYDSGSMFLGTDMDTSPGPWQPGLMSDPSLPNILNPRPEDTTVLPMLRVIGGGKAWPKDGPVFAPNCLRWSQPDVTHGAKGFIAGYYFPGPGGGEKFIRGTGNYCLGLTGGGEAHLYEAVLYGSDYTTKAWKRRRVFRYAPPYAGAATSHRIIIFAYAASDLLGNLYSTSLVGKGGAIYFDVSATDDGGLSSGNKSRVVTARSQGVTYFPPTWIVSGRNNCYNDPIPIGMDIRQDILMMIQISVGCA